VHKLDLLINDFNENNVNYCVWKGPSKYSLVKTGKEDLDLLIDNKSLEKAFKLLKKRGFFEVVNSIEKDDFGTHDFLYLTENSEWIHIHVHLYILFGNSVVRDYYLPIESEILDSKEFNLEHKIWVINSYDDILLSLSRYIIRRKPLIGYANLSLDLQTLKMYYLNRAIESLGDRKGVYNDYLIDASLNLEEISERSVVDLRSKVAKTISPFRDKKNISYYINYLLVLTKLVWKKVMKKNGEKKLKSKGFFVAFVGIDGSGKSSAIERLKNTLSAHLKVCTISVGSGVSGASWYRSLAFKVFGNKAKFKSHVKIRAASETIKKYPWYYSLWLIICYYDKNNEIRKGFQAARNGSVVLCDRWLQTQVHNFIDSPRINKASATNFLTKIVYNLEKKVFLLTKVNKPDLIIHFDVSPENSLIRKPDDLTLELATFASEKIKEIEWDGVDVIRINADECIVDVDKALNEIINKYLSIYQNES